MCINDTFFTNAISINNLPATSGANVEIEGGWADSIDSTAAAIDIESSQGVKVIGMQITSTSDTTLSAGVLAQNSSNLVISNNTFRKATGSFIDLNNTNDSTVTGNAMLSQASMTQAILLTGTSSWNVISGNSVAGTATTGVVFGSSTANNTMLDSSAIDTTSITTAIANSGTNNTIGASGGAVSSVFGRTGAVVAVSGDYSVGQVTGAAPLASPAFTGTPTAPTAATPTNTTQLATTAFVQAALAAAGSAAGIVTYSGPSLTFTGTAFFPIGGGGLSSTTEANVDLASPASATVKNFTVQLSAAPGTGNSIVFTWRANAASTAVTCTISGSATACSDLTHSFTASAGDLLDIQSVTTGTVLSASTAVMGTQVGIAGSGGGGIAPQTVIAANSADMEFTSCISSAQKDYQIRLSSIILATGSQDLQIQFSTNGGSTWDTGADYNWVNLQAVYGSTAGSPSAIGANGIILTGGGGGQTGTPFPVNATLTLHDPLNAASFKFVDGTGNRVDNSSTFVALTIGGIYTSNTAVNAFRLISTSGNITSGQAVCQPLAQ